MTRPADDSRVVRVQCWPAPQEPSNPLAELMPLTPAEARTLFAFALFTKPLSGASQDGSADAENLTVDRSNNALTPNKVTVAKGSPTPK